MCMSYPTNKPLNLPGFKLDIDDGELYYVPSWLSKTESIQLYKTFKDELAWQQDQLLVFGKWHPIPRLQAWYGEPEASYKFSGQSFTPRTWHAELSLLRQRLLAIGVSTNAVLANFYRDGHDKMGWHSDNERSLGIRATIASISLGAARTLQLKHKVTGKRIDLLLESGSLLIMAGEMQQYWLHALPARKAVTQGRINLTYRLVNSAENAWSRI